MTHLERLRDESGFIHKRIFGGIKGVIGGLPSLLTGNPLGLVAGGIRGFIEGDVPGTEQGCPPGFISSPAGCVPKRATIAFEPRGVPRAGIGGALGRFREEARRRAAPPVPGLSLQTIAPPQMFIDGGGRPSPNGIPRPEIPTLAVTGQFGAGFEASIVSREMRLCPPKTVLGVDGVCYNRRDLRNDERAWPRGRRPLLTGGEMRAVSTASAAAKKLQRKQKQLQELGLLPKPQRARRALLPGHRATLTHAGATGHE